MSKFKSFAVIAGVLATGSNVHAGGSPGLPPLFIEQSPPIVFVDLNAGQTSFEGTGTAIDLDSPTVYFFAAGIQPFMTFDAAPGNPGTFRLHAENLTAAHFGGYLVDVVAIDALDGTGRASSVSFTISIVPEPTVFVGLAIGVPLFRRRR